MKYIALKELPHGQQPGDVFEEDEAIGSVLVTVGAARVAEPDEIAPRRRYQRRDLQARP